MTGRWTVALLCLVYLVVSSVNAVAEGIMPRYTYAEKTEVSISLSGGVATVRGKITPNGDYETQVIVRLQRCDDGIWETLSYWTGHNANGTSEAGGTRYITRGYDYRAYVIGKIYDSNGNLLEMTTKYSAVKSY